MLEYYVLRNIVAIQGGDFMVNQQLATDLMNVFMGIKNQHFHNIIKVEGHTHNEKLVLFLLHEIMGEENKDTILLSKLRDRLRLAPSTVTPIITSLENKGLIERVIDKSDRRNIYLKLSSKGIEFTQEAHDQLTRHIHEYIEYMGEEDTRAFMRLLEKTNDFFIERKDKRK